MSEHKPKGTESPNSGVVVGDSKSNRQNHSVKQKILWVCIIALTVTGTLEAVRHFYSNNSNSTIKKDQIKSQTFTPDQRAQVYADQGKYDLAQQTLEDQLQIAKDQKARAMIYSSQAVIALNAQKYNDAQKYALQNEKAAPSSSSAELVGQIAVLKGDKVTAQEYFSKAISRLDKNDKAYSLVLRSYQTELEQAKQ